MMPQPTLPLAGLPDTERSINPFWFGQAADFVLHVTERGGSVTADRIHEVVPGRPAHSNAIGALFAQLHRSGRIRRLDHAPSRRRTRHGSTIGIWVGTGQADR